MFTILGADGKEYGPVPAHRVHEWIHGGRANLQTKARRDGETEWKTLGDFSEFNAAVTAPPMAVPPAADVTAPDPKPDLIPASRLRRLGGALIDGFLVWLCKLPILFAVLPVVREGVLDPQAVKPEMVVEAAMGAISSTLPFLGVLAVLQMTLLCVRSQSFGKLLLGMRIVSAKNGEPGGPVRAFVLRGLITWLLEQIPVLGFIFWVVDCAFIFREDRRCIHDFIAGTQVVKA